MDTVDGFFFTPAELAWLADQALLEAIRLERGDAPKECPAADILARFNFYRDQQRVSNSKPE